MANTFIHLPPTAVTGPIEVIVDAANDSISIKNGANQLAVNADGSINVVTSGGATGGLTDAQLRATAVPVSLASTTITNFPASQAVTGTFFPATQPVSASSLPLPSGASTETTLSALNTKMPSGLVVTTGRLQVELPAGGSGLTNTELRAAAVPVSLTSTTVTGTVAVSGPLTDTQLRATAVPVSLASTTITGTVAVSGPLTDTQLRAAVVPVSLASTTITNFPASQAVTGAFFQTTQPVSAASLPLPTGAATETTLSTLNTKIPSGLVVTTGRLQVELPAGGTGLTNTELRASAVPVSLTSTTVTGTVVVSGPLTDTQIRATALPVSHVDTTASGSIAAISQSVALALNGKSGVALQVTGTWVGTLQFEGTVDGTNWAAVNGVVAGASTPGTTVTANGLVRLTPSGLAQVRVTSTAWTSGTAAISLRGSDATGGTFLNQSLTAGTNIIGKVGIDQTTPGTTNLVALSAETTKVIGTINIAAAQTLATVSAVTAITNALPTGTNSIGTVQAPAITKNTQSVTGFTVQKLSDAGRNARHFMLDAYTAAPLIEAVQSVVQWYGNAAVLGSTQPAVVPAGKTLRLQSWSISTKSLATVGSAVVRVRVNTLGLGILASPLVYTFEAGSKSGATTVAMTGGLDSVSGVFPEGFEIPAGSGLAFTMAGYGPTGTLAAQGVTRFTVTGYEY